MMVPKYLRPVFDRAAYGPLSRMEKAIRFVIFVPLVFVLQVPAILLLLLFGLSLGIGPMRVLLDNAGVLTLPKILMFIVAPLMFLVGVWIRKYFLPFD